MSYAVIGANFGDEGKGLITDYLTRNVDGHMGGCRFNGGAQASHTVETARQRHAFSHLTAGTFAGASTYLSSDFILNPYLLRDELTAVGIEFPRLHAHPRARVTTIFDMAINAMAEESRGMARHGSCGVGINETVTRHDRGISSRLEELPDIKPVMRLFDRLADEWFPARVAELGIDLDLPGVTRHASTIKNISPRAHAELLDELLVPLRAALTTKRSARAWVLEGAQGLALDEQLGEFPHVTRSLTGLPQAITAAKELGLTTLKPVYVTRAYLTRHGAGPLAGTGSLISVGGRIADATNTPNPFQGSMRFAPLDLEGLGQRIRADMGRGAGMNIEPPIIAVTCMDQVKGRMWTMQGETTPEKLLHQIEEATGFPVSFVSHGPRATDVRVNLSLGVAQQLR